MIHPTFNKKNKTSECLQKVCCAKPNDHIQKAFHKLKQNLSVTSPGVLSCLERWTKSDTKDIELCQHKDSVVHVLPSYIQANIMLINMKETSGFLPESR